MRYLLYASHSYAFSILRPVQRAIALRGGEAAWYLEATCPDLLTPHERRLTLWQARAWQPDAVLAPGNWVHPLIPGIKVEVFHGYPLNKRGEATDDHFRLRGWFDIYCTAGPTSTLPFNALAERHRYFKVYETGWPKTDDCFLPTIQRGDRRQETPTIVVATTFTKGISALGSFLPIIRRLAQERPWRWIITMHPKLLADTALTDACRQLADDCHNVSFEPQFNTPEQLQHTDVMLCDSSSIILEYMLLSKPVVTFRNTMPGPWLLDCHELSEIEQAIERALTRPATLMAEMERWTATMEAHRDGRNSLRVLEAIDDFRANYQGRLPRKPLNIFRKLKLLMR